MGIVYLFSSSLDFETKVEHAHFLRRENPTEAIALYREILNMPNENDSIIKEKENCTLELASLFGELKDIDSLSQLLESSRDFFNVISKAKSAKLGKSFPLVFET